MDLVSEVINITEIEIFKFNIVKLILIRKYLQIYKIIIKKSKSLIYDKKIDICHISACGYVFLHMWSEIITRFWGNL